MSSLRNPATTIASLRAFAAHRGAVTLTFGDIGMDFYHAYRDWVLAERGQKGSTFATRVRDVKAFMNEGLADGAHGLTEHRSRRFAKPPRTSRAASCGCGRGRRATPWRCR